MWLTQVCVSHQDQIPQFFLGGSYIKDFDRGREDEASWDDSLPF